MRVLRLISLVCPSLFLVSSFFRRLLPSPKGTRTRCLDRTRKSDAKNLSRNSAHLSVLANKNGVARSAISQSQFFRDLSSFFLSPIENLPPKKRRGFFVEEHLRIYAAKNASLDSYNAV